MAKTIDEWPVKVTSTKDMAGFINEDMTHQEIVNQVIEKIENWEGSLTELASYIYPAINNYAYTVEGIYRRKTLKQASKTMRHVIRNGDQVIRIEEPVAERNILEMRVNFKGVSLRFKELTALQHKSQVVSLQKDINGIQDSIALHEEAIRVLAEAGVDRLQDLEASQIPQALAG